jgi:maleate isomerase
MTCSILAATSGASAHFARFRVTQIALSAQALGQFDDTHILAAADLLADAKVDVIGWSGTAAGWLGFDTDEKLCLRIKERTGISATTAVLALNDILRIRKITKLGLVTPYTPDVQKLIIENYRSIGIDVVAERHENISVNYDFALVSRERVSTMFADVARGDPHAIVTYCTNLNAADLAETLEAQWNIPLLDTVSTTIWGMLRLCGRLPSEIRGWGMIFDTTE